MINNYINNIPSIVNNKKEEKLLTLIIPKINLNKDIYPINSSNNNINNNIKLLSSSNINKNTYILASHSGTNNNAYFNNLPNLNIKDKVYINKSNNIYTYQITNIYYINKTGYLEISKNIDNTIILITCSRIYKNKQLIIISKLINTNNVK